MKTALMLTLVLLGLLNFAFGQETQTWDKWKWLIGTWSGEGSGQTGQGVGTFSFKPDLDNKVLIRKNHAEYPATNSRPAIIHDDLMIVYLDNSGNPSNAIYFDNEGHTIKYLITYTEKSIVLTSEKSSTLPVFRLTYNLINDGMINVKFEMSQDGENFIIYTEGKCKRTFLSLQ